MNKQEAIELLRDVAKRACYRTGRRSVHIDEIVELVNQIDEPQKPVVPKFVGEYIEFNKSWSEDGQECIEVDNSELWFALNGDNQGMPNSVSDWLFNEEKVETFAKAWLNGYEIEQEPLYTVEIPKLGGGMMVKTLEQALKDESKKLKAPTNIRPYGIGYRVVSKNGNILALKDGASVFSLPSEAKKAIQKEFGKDDPNFDIGRRKIEEVAIVNFEKLKKFLEEVE
jgi:hypothetical protein